MKEESNVLSPFSAICCSRFCLNVITAMSEEAPLHASWAAPPLAAMQRSSSDKILAAVTEDMLSKLMPLQPPAGVRPELANNWIWSTDCFVSLAPLCELSKGFCDFATDDDGKCSSDPTKLCSVVWVPALNKLKL